MKRKFPLLAGGMCFFLLLLILFLRTYVIKVNGRSMYPILKNGDYVIIDRNNKGNLTNRIVAFRDTKPIIHRVIEEKNGDVLTKGDANQISDEWIKREQIIGKVIFIIPFWFVNLFSNISCVIILLMIMVVIFEFIKKKLHDRKQKNISIRKTIS